MKFLFELINGEQLLYSELKVKDYKELLKCSFEDTPCKTIFLNTFFEILEKLTGKCSSFFKNELNILDMFCLLLDMRSNFLDNICNVMFLNEDKQMNLELRLDYLKEELTELHKHSATKVISDNNFEIVLGYPSITRLLESNNGREYLSFVQQLKIFNSNETVTEIKIETNTQAHLLLERVTPKKFIEIINEYNILINTLTNYNFLSRYNINQNLNLSFNIETFIWLTKLIFNEQLLDLYDNLFYLACYGHMNPEYIESCSVGEYKLFTSQLRQTFKSDKQEQQTNEQLEEDFDENDGLFGD